MDKPQEAGQSPDVSKEPIPADQLIWQCRKCGSLDTQAWKRPPSRSERPAMDGWRETVLKDALAAIGHADSVGEAEQRIIDLIEKAEARALLSMEGRGSSGAVAPPRPSSAELPIVSEALCRNNRSGFGKVCAGVCGDCTVPGQSHACELALEIWGTDAQEILRALAGKDASGGR